MRRRGFTLIELLVVVAIVAILLGILVSSLRAVRARARAIVCASNIRQLSIGLFNYDAANESLPPGLEISPYMSPNNNGYAGFYGTIDLPGLWWFDFSQEVNHRTLDGLDVLTCPSKRQGDLRLDLDILAGNYGANMSLCRIDQYIKPYRNGFRGKPRSLASIRRVSETLMLVDSGYALICWWHVTAEPPEEISTNMLGGGEIQHTAYVPGMSLNRDKVLWAGQSEDAIDGRHPNRTVNVGFADGSVSAKQADELMVEKTGDDQWNNSPLWEPSRPGRSSANSQPTAP